MTYEQVRSLIGENAATAQVAAAIDHQGPGNGGLVVTVPVDQWFAFAQFAKNTLGFRFFSFLSAVDLKDQGLEVVIQIDNTDDKLAMVVKTQLGAGVSACASLVPVFRGADWMERECFDMFGIRFEGHPDLRRILLGDEWVGHPLLKSYAVDTPYPPYR